MKKERATHALAANRLRIIAGLWRGRRLAFPDSPGLRPTPDRVRETIFNWLAPVICNARCLDLYCGSGALGFEALSRGARSVTFVDNAPQVIAQLTNNAGLLGCTDAQIIHADALDWLNLQSEDVMSGYDVVFLDPPFRKNLLFDVCKRIEEKQLIKPQGYVYLEAERNHRLKLPENWSVHRHKKAGKIDFYLCATQE